MRVEIVSPKELDAELIGCWRNFQSSSAGLRTPFFSPEFTLAVGGARQDAAVAIIENDGVVQGFFPFHRCAGRVAKPIGGQIADYHGIIHAPTFVPDGPALLKACGLTAYDFNHAPLTQTALVAGCYHFSSSPHIDLSQGYDAYAADRPKAWAEAMRHVRRRRRKIEREIGPMRFEYHSPSDDIYRSHVKMRNHLYERANVKSLLGCNSWIDRTLAAIRMTNHLHFAGLMTALYAGDRLIAAHFGMRSKDVWHWWFSSYDTELANYGPGIMLILEAARHAPTVGLSLIDFGRGDSPYKLLLSNGATRLCEGSIEVQSSFRGILRRTQKIALRSIMPLPLGQSKAFLRRGISRVITGGIRLST